MGFLASVFVAHLVLIPLLANSRFALTNSKLVTRMNDVLAGHISAQHHQTTLLKEGA